MAMYVIGTLPLINKISGEETQSWYADNASASGKVSDLRRWWDKLLSIGPLFGYYPNLCKTWLLVKPEHHQTAEECFYGTGVNITTEGLRHLGAVLGSDSFVRSKVNAWAIEVNRLAEFANCHPQAAYTVLTQGLMSRWTFIMRTLPITEELLQPLEDALRYQLLPAITGRQSLNDTEREFLSLPARLGASASPS